ncbi:MAG: hypothetical protein AABX44_00750 [Nanoarchaeota archaeon]
MAEIGTNYPEIKSKKYNKDHFVYVPSLELFIAKEKTYLGKNWFESHKLMQENQEFMPTIPQFTEFLKYLKNSNNQEYLIIYHDITDIKPSWRGEWLDAIFDIKEDQMYINYAHKLDKNGNLMPQNSESLNRETLMKDKKINLKDWINSSHTKQGLPDKNVREGESYFYYPRNKKAARFGANSALNYLSCGWNPSVGAGLGTRAVIKKLINLNNINKI